MEQVIEFISNHLFLNLALVIVVVLLIRSWVAPRLSGVGDVDPAGAIRMINHDDAAVVDVRAGDEFAQGHILNALNLPLGTLENHLKTLEDHKDRPVIVNCRSGQRSAQAARTLRKHGFEKVYNLSGGIMAWEKAELPLTRGKSKKR